jgi:Lysyl oxidase
MRPRSWATWRCLFLGLLFAFGAVVGAQPRDPGALIRVTLKSRVGVLLDEVPTSVRTTIAADLLKKPASFWTERAIRQVEHTLYRLTSGRRTPQGRPKGQLPLPPQETWTIMLEAGGAGRTTVDGHDLVVADYAMTGILLSDSESPGRTEPSLGIIGGKWSESFVLPVDPELLFQRTGYACINEVGYPPDSIDGENARFQYDDTCLSEAPDNLSCHQSMPLPTNSCVVALKNFGGHVETHVDFERLPWDNALADQARVGSLPSSGGADLAVIAGRLSNQRISYSYVPADSCAVQEQCVNGSGWRRLLEFDASVQNVGDKDLKIGDVGSLSVHHVFEYSACHHHYHFRHYGDFSYGDTQISRKQSFCLQSTARYSNNEATSLNSLFAGCHYQGISTGWGDDYLAGLECQWLDVTDVRSSTAAKPLTFTVNPDRFLCEGDPVLDRDGSLTFTSVKADNGGTEEIPVCRFRDNWNANNRASLQVTLSDSDNMVTMPCAFGELGPRRDCNFKKQEDSLPCKPGSVVTLSCSAPSPQVVRICERSAALDQAIPCTFQQSLTSAVVGESTVVSFNCPMPRDSAEPGGAYSVYVGRVYGNDAAQPVACVPTPK